MISGLFLFLVMVVAVYHTTKYTKMMMMMQASDPDDDIEHWTLQQDRAPHTQHSTQKCLLRAKKTNIGFIKPNMLFPFKPPRFIHS